MRLTAIVPAIGAVLLLNETVVAGLQLAKQFAIDAGFGTEGQPVVTLRTLYFVYFGLTLLGIGSILFSIFCPTDIKRNSSRVEQALTLDLDRNPVIAKAYLQFILDRFFALHNDSGDPKGPITALEFTAEAEQEFDSLVDEMFEAVEPPDTQDEDKADDEFWSELYLATGYPNTYHIAHLVWSNPKVVWAFTQPFRALAVRFGRDIAFVRYSLLDHSRYRLRVCIAAFYAGGFLFLAVPTFSTFARVAIGFFGGVI